MDSESQPGRGEGKTGSEGIPPKGRGENEKGTVKMGVQILGVQCMKQGFNT